MRSHLPQKRVITPNDKKCNRPHKRLLTDCNSWSSPCTHINRGTSSSVTEMAKSSRVHSKNRNGLLLKHWQERYPQNGICHDEKLENLLVLLEEDSTSKKASTATVANLPSCQDVLRAFSVSPTAQTLKMTTN